MAIGETIPTIGELKGNTILELFKNGYNALKNVITRKQNKLIAGDNIVIDENTNRISAIEGGSATLEDYYTKSEINEFLTDIDGEIDTKANSVDVYDKTDADALLDTKADKLTTYTKTEVDSLISGSCEIVTPILENSAGGNGILFDYALEDGDIVSCNIKNSTGNTIGSFVLTKTNVSSTNHTDGVTLTYRERTDANNFTIYFKEFSLYNYEDNKYIVQGLTYSVTFASGIASISSHSFIPYSVDNSVIKIYKRKVVQ